MPGPSAPHDCGPFRSHRRLAEPGGVLSLFQDFQTPLPFY